MRNPIKIALKPLIITGVILAAFAAAIFVYTVLAGPKTLYGKEVIYSNHYSHSATVEILPNGKLLVANCGEADVLIVITEDTLIVKNKQEVLRLKPYRVDDNGGLHCYDKDSIDYIFLRMLHKEEEPTKENEAMFMMNTGEQRQVILSNRTGCPELQ